MLPVSHHSSPSAIRLCLLIAAIVAACQPQPGEQPEAEGGIGVAVPAADAHLILSEEGLLGQSPLFHDEQRLIAHDGSGNYQFGPRGKLFAVRNLDSVSFRTNKPQAMAVFWIQPGVEPRPTGFREGWTCVLLRQEQGNKWGANLEHLSSVSVHADSSIAGPACMQLEEDWDAQPPPASTTVKPERFHPTRDTIPPGARWDWDFKRRTPYIGIKCASNWCEVGADSVSRKPAHANRRGKIKGYYDEQFLPIPASDGTPLVAPLLATLLPTEDLIREDKFSANPVEGDSWEQTGVILLSLARVAGNPPLRFTDPEVIKVIEYYDARWSMDGSLIAAAKTASASTKQLEVHLWMRLNSDTAGFAKYLISAAMKPKASETGIAMHVDSHKRTIEETKSGRAPRGILRYHPTSLTGSARWGGGELSAQGWTVCGPRCCEPDDIS